nr:ATP-binding cassette domain-containing protein [uncultured Desulfobacter sp.]
MDQGLCHLRVQNLSKFYGKTIGCNNINFDLAPDEVIDIVGESGSGKSTLLKCIAGNETPTNGPVFFNSSVGFLDLIKADEILLRKIARDWLERLGLIPTEGGADIQVWFAPLMAHLEKNLGIKVEAFSASDYAGIITAMAPTRSISWTRMLLISTPGSWQRPWPLPGRWAPNAWCTTADDFTPKSSLTATAHQLPFGPGDNHMPVGWGRLPIQAILEIILPEYEGLLMMEVRSRYFKDIPTSKTNLIHILSRLQGAWETAPPAVK